MVPEHRETQVPEKKKKKSGYDVAMRIGIVKGFAASHPKAKGTNLNFLTCEELDLRRVGLSPKWRPKYKVETWVQGYAHDKVKKLIYKMFATDKKRNL